jgi:hypothetical protein
VQYGIAKRHSEEKKKGGEVSEKGKGKSLKPVGRRSRPSSA